MKASNSHSQTINEIESHSGLTTLPQTDDYESYSAYNTLPSVHRHITTHSKKGTSIFDASISAPAQWQHISLDPEGPPLASFFLAYTTSGFPVDVTHPSDKEDKRPRDIVQYEKKLLDPPPELSYEDASILRYVDFRPGTAPYMHRTQSLDYGIVLEGEIELILDSGEKRILRRGDSCVQRATMHGWRNTSDTQWARMVFVLISSTEPAIYSEKLDSVMPSL